MAKSARSSTRKANNQRLKANVFGPVESARAERLSAKLLELAAQSKPTDAKDDEMKVVEDVDAADDAADKEREGKADEATMEVDSAAKPSASSSSSKKNRVSKRRKTSKIVFPKYKDRRSGKKGKN